MDSGMNDLALMRDLVATLGAFLQISGIINADIDDTLRPTVVSGSYTVLTTKSTDLSLTCQIITGATGSLGVHLVNKLLKGTGLDIVALVRARNNAHAEERVNEAMKARGLEDLSSAETHYGRSRMQCLASELSRTDLGLEKDVYDQLARSSVAVIHVGRCVFASSAPEIMLNRRLLVGLVCELRRELGELRHYALSRSVLSHDDLRQST